MALVHVHHFPLVAARHDDHIDTMPFQVIDKGNDARNACVIDVLFKLIETLLHFMPRFLFVFKIPTEYLSQRPPLDKMCKMGTPGLYTSPIRLQQTVYRDSVSSTIPSKSKSAVLYIFHLLL